MEIRSPFRVVYNPQLTAKLLEGNQWKVEMEKMRTFRGGKEMEMRSENGLLVIQERVPANGQRLQTRP